MFIEENAYFLHNKIMENSNRVFYKITENMTKKIDNNTT